MCAHYSNATAGSVTWSPHLMRDIHSIEQEGQHPLTGQRAANFRLLANQ